jgi:glutathione S-transferase
MTEFKLHCFPQSGNAYKVGLCLSLLDADWEPVAVDYFGGETRTTQWREAVNVMGEVPVLEHRGQKLTQSGIILDNSPEEKREIWRWILFDNHKFTSYFATHRWLRTFAKPAGHPEVISFLKARADAALGIVEDHLANHLFILGEQPTIADLSLVGYLYFPEEETGCDLAASFPRVQDWTERVAALRGWRHPYELLAASEPSQARAK